MPEIPDTNDKHPLRCWLPLDWLFFGAVFPVFLIFAAVVLLVVDAWAPLVSAAGLALLAWLVPRVFWTVVGVSCIVPSLLLLVIKGNWKLWATLGWRCFSRRCRYFSARNSAVPENLLHKAPEILAWYASFWGGVGLLTPGLSAMFQGSLWVLNWALTLSVVMFLAALIPESPHVFLMTAGGWALLVGCAPLLAYWALSKGITRERRKILAEAEILFPGEREDFSVCGSPSASYAALPLYMAIAAVTGAGFPHERPSDAWIALFLALLAGAFSVQLAAIRYWLFHPLDATPEFFSHAGAAR